LTDEHLPFLNGDFKPFKHVSKFKANQTALEWSLGIEPGRDDKQVHFHHLLEHPNQKNDKPLCFS
jgi:hypothetical protein